MKEPTMNKSIALLFAAFALVIPQAATAQQASSVQTLRGSDAADADRAPETRQQMGKEPGAQKRLARTFQGQPPLIPHSTDNLDGFTLEDNPCLSCHDTKNFKAANAPVIARSHLTMVDGRITGTTDMRRYNCTGCHVPQVDAPPLVANTFRGTPAPAAKKTK
jgi:cytochrome c-type protein NapB